MTFHEGTWRVVLEDQAALPPKRVVGTVVVTAWYP
jgi:hypothetical protein